MSITKRKVSLVCFFLFFLNYSSGCGCDTLSFKQAVQEADEIFIGRLIRLREVTNGQDQDAKYTRVWSALFEVIQKWKGGTSKYVEVFEEGTSCDYYFNFPYKTYLVYATKSDGFLWDPYPKKVLWTWLCTRNADEFSFNYPDSTRWDDRPRLDKQFPNPVKLSTFEFSSDLILISVGVALACVLSFFLGRRKS